MVILSRWDRERNVPVVFPSKRDQHGRHKVFETERELLAEIEWLESMNLLTAIPYRVDVTPPDEAQAFMDERAKAMVAEHRDALEDPGLLRVYGFTDEQLANMGFPTGKGETL
jgi:hypothetical protein